MPLLADSFSLPSGSNDQPAPQPDPATTAPATPRHQPAPVGRKMSGHYPHSRRTAGHGAPEGPRPSYASIDDHIRATITSPTGGAFLRMPDGSVRLIEGIPLPPAAPTAPVPAEPHPFQAVLDEFPEVGQAGSAANQIFHRAYRKAGSNPHHALHIARTVLQR